MNARATAPYTVTDWLLGLVSALALLTVMLLVFITVFPRVWPSSLPYQLILLAGLLGSTIFSIRRARRGRRSA